MRTCRRRIILIIAGILALGASGRARAQGCAEDPAFATLDFWIGEWDVLAGGQEVGRNRIEEVIEGCAVLEHWTGAGGGQGKSLFYLQPATGEWKQVWVTSTPNRPGGVKEKTLVGRLPGGGVRFQGEIPLVGGGSYLDRTTLTPADDGTVRQVIERSTDGGQTWVVDFDAVYRRRTP